ncbi:MAG: flagellar motor protein MotB [Odoribacter sp.]|nr:flagellar motor protein MotB [Odoribacter sp.]
MKSIINYQNGFCLERFYSLIIKSLFIGTLVFAGIQSSVLAQDSMFKKSSWWLGTSGGANLNLYHGSTQVVNSGLTISAAYQNRKGIGLFAFPVLEFHRPDSKLGFILNAGYESRRGSFDEAFSTKLAYITLEPNLRLNLFSSPLYLFSGPRFALNIDNRYTYRQGVNSSETSGNFSNMKKSLVSMQIGAGYDLSLTTENKKTQVILAPFVSFHPSFGQKPRSIESWNLSTLRAGIAIKFGRSHKIAIPEQVEVPVVIAVEPEARFLLNDSRNIPAEPSVEEVFPLRNYIYFNSKSSAIPNINVKPGNDQEKEPKEDRVALSPLLNLSDSSFRQMIVHDNFLNILGDRMVKNPSNAITLIGSSEHGAKDGQQMAEAIKLFLVGVYGIDASKIDTKGRRNLKIQSEQSVSILKIGLLQEGNRKVLIESKSRNLQMEFRGGSGVPLKPLKLNMVQETNAFSYFTFKTEGANEVFSSWILKITDDQGNVQNFGPYTKDLISIPGKSILGNRTYGKYEIMMSGKLMSGETVKKDTTAYLVLLTPPASDRAMRFSFLYEHNNSKAINIFNRYLTDVVAPKIPENATVVIHGHTENAGARDYELKLFLNRANDAKTIIENALAKTGRHDVQFEVYTLGNDLVLAPFGNSKRLESFYNRTIIIDVISNE